MSHPQVKKPVSKSNSKQSLQRKEQLSCSLQAFFYKYMSCWLNTETSEHDEMRARDD